MPENPEPHDEDQDLHPHQEGDVDPGGGEPEPAVPEDGDTFPRDYVEKLRDENARYRTRATKADEAAARLLAATVREATAGILTDPTDLPEGDYLDDDGWPDPEAIATAARELVEAKPHLGDRRPRGSIGQGATTGRADVNLATILKERA